MADASGSRTISPSPSQLPPVPSSPVYSIASTANPISQFNLPAPPAPRPSHPVLSKADLGHSQEAYADLLSSAKSYRLALAQLSTAASAFGSALESCARLKEARAEPLGPSLSSGGAALNMTASYTTKGACTADVLMSASGVHHLIANHQQILSETVYRSFEVPLLHDLDKWRTVITDEEETYQQNIKAQAKEVKRLEKEGMKIHKQRKRDVARFRAHLVQLTSKLDGLTSLHADHARTLLRESQETSNRIVDASCSLVRAEVDIFEAIARKGWSGGGLDDILEKGQDLFAPEENNMTAATIIGGTHATNSETAKLFSILPPRSILADSASEVVAPAPMRPGAGGHARSDSLLVDTERYQSLTAVTSDARSPGVYGDGDRDSVFSADFNKPRGARPWSPQPIRRVPMDVTAQSLGGMVDEDSKRGRNDEGRDDDDDDDDDGGMARSQFLMPSMKEQDESNGGEGWGSHGQSGKDTPKSQHGRSSPEFITDESSPEARWSGDDKR